MTSNKDLILDIYEKVNGRSDQDWCEIAQRHALPISTETQRKAGVGIRMASEAGVLDFDGEHPDTYEKLHIAKKQFFDQRRLYNAQLTKDARAEHLIERLSDSAAMLARDYPMLEKRRWMSDDSECEAVLMLADWHVGLETDNIWNRFDIGICRERLSQLCSEARRALALHKPRKLHVALLGDFVEGAIHTSCRVASEEDVCDQIMIASEMIAQVIDDLREIVPEIIVYSTYGNHARTVAELKDSVHSDNIEKLIPFWLEQRFKDADDVTIQDAGVFEFIEMNVCGKLLIGTHGDLEKKNSPLVLNAVFQRRHGKSIDYLLTGHLHSTAIEDSVGIKSVRVSSLCGTDEYAKNKRLFAEPGQTMLIFRDGKKTYERLDIEFDI